MTGNNWTQGDKDLPDCLSDLVRQAGLLGTTCPEQRSKSGQVL